MKRIGLIAALAAAAVSAFAFGVADREAGSRVRAQGSIVSEVRDLPRFSGIDLSGVGAVRYHESDAFRVTVRTHQSLIGLVETEVSSGILALKIEQGWSVVDVRTLEFDVEAPRLERVSISGSGSFRAMDVLDVPEFLFRVSGSGEAVAQVDTDRLECRVSGSGSLSFTGDADELVLDLSGSGAVDALDLRARDADVKISGSSEVKLNVAEKLTARISGSGNIDYRGTPRIDYSGSGSGKIQSIQ
jgi:hypothetical protein